MSLKRLKVASPLLVSVLLLGCYYVALTGDFYSTAPGCIGWMEDSRAVAVVYAGKLLVLLGLVGSLTCTGLNIYADRRAKVDATAQRNREIRRSFTLSFFMLLVGSFWIDMQNVSFFERACGM